MLVSVFLESVDSPETIQTYVTEINEATPPYSIIITLGVSFKKKIIPKNFLCCKIFSKTFAII